MNTIIGQLFYLWEWIATNNKAIGHLQTPKTFRFTGFDFSENNSGDGSKYSYPRLSLVADEPQFSTTFGGLFTDESDKVFMRFIVPVSITDKITDPTDYKAQLEVYKSTMEIWMQILQWMMWQRQLDTCGVKLLEYLNFKNITHKRIGPRSSNTTAFGWAFVFEFVIPIEYAENLSLWNDFVIPPMP